MHPYRSSVRSVFTLLLILTAVPTIADEGKIPIWEPIILDSTIPGVDISGSYVVTENITAPPGSGPVLTILCDGTDDVDINLNGFTLFGDSAGGSDIITATACRTLRVHNGSLRAQGPPPGASLFVDSTEKLTAEGLRISDGGYGIQALGSPNFTIKNNTIVNPDPDGIYLDGAGLAVPISGTIERNLVKDAIGGGITVIDNHSSVAIVHNRIDRTFTASGIFVQSGNGCLITQNTVEEAAQEGIFLKSVEVCKIHNNVSTFNGGNGILMDAVFNSLVIDNVAGRNTMSGIVQLGETTKFDNNVVSSNGCWGLHLAGRSNTYARNSAKFNSGAAACAGACGVAPVEVCPIPYGGGAFAPDLCVDAVDNVSYCDNLMPGPPRS